VTGQLGEVWCRTCERPATGHDAQCDFCRSGVPPAITDDWLARQWLTARGQRLITASPEPSEAEIEGRREEAERSREYWARMKSVPDIPPDDRCPDCGHPADIHDRRGDAADAECGESCDTCIEARHDFLVERQMQEWGRFT
jgi:hypothetical protein